MLPFWEHSISAKITKTRRFVLEFSKCQVSANYHKLTTNFFMLDR